MAEYSAAAANAMLDPFEATVGANAVLKIRTGARPAHVADADTGTVLATLSLPAVWMATASGGSKAKAGTWEDLSADNTGTAEHYRLYESDGTTCHHQGSVTITGGGGDMTLDSISFTAGQSFSVTGFTLTINI
jgi:hypothetical protein